MKISVQSKKQTHRVVFVMLLKSVSMQIHHAIRNVHMREIRNYHGQLLNMLPRILDIPILQDKTLFCVLEASNIVCWLVNQPIAKLDLFKSPDCLWICKTYANYCYRNSATVSRLIQSPTLQWTIFCGVHSDLGGKGIRVYPAWCYPTIIS